ncbi:IclR family transcriptional regulator [Isoptericola cucumis]|uniref:IclR family transcriptional regulator n=1 Tax=Isoptericola cucumis TaxID=1776856 RepID=A0ABQ2B2B0_9MICO|nr:IclR family transcriptional regulator [Isoptericola cucumis]GGI04492.1 IclR family transcriptional regulator [Isoptericola cucumis]
MSEAATASEKTLMVLEAAMTHERFSEIVAAVHLPKATVHRILATLVDRDFIRVTAGGEHVPGPKVLSLAGRAYDRIDVSSIVQPYVDDLVRRVQCTVHVGVRSGDEIIYLVRTDSDKPYRMPSRVGAAIPLHTSAIGKSILARLDDDELVRFVNRAGLVRRTARTLTTLKALRAEVADIRRDGHAFDREENVPGVVCIGTALRDHTGHSNYGLSISTLALEHTEEQLVAMAGDLHKAAADITYALGGADR